MALQARILYDAQSLAARPQEAAALSGEPEPSARASTAHRPRKDNALPELGAHLVPTPTLVPGP